MPAGILARGALMSVRIWTIVVLWMVYVVAGCTQPASRGYVSRQGQIMGSYYAITARCFSNAETSMDAAVAALDRVDRQMSTWKEDSNLSRLNRLPITETMPVPEELWEVLSLSEEVRVASGGVFDVSVGALVKAWGFGNAEPGPAPAAELIESLLPSKMEAGYRLLPPDQVGRNREDVFVDVSAVAPGYAVDLAVDVMVEMGCPDVMVDVSGEVGVRGKGPKGDGWRIGIESPELLHGGLEGVLILKDRAVSTSGDYRNFRDIGGRRISHTIDPRTGRPVEHGLASVTVVHDTAALADAWSTALNVLGPSAGLALAGKKNLPVYMLVRDADGIDAVYTESMKSVMDLP
jgi:thiamine biosynthesis lipoprotein